MLQKISKETILQRLGLYLELQRVSNPSYTYRLFVKSTLESCFRNGGEINCSKRLCIPQGVYLCHICRQRSSYNCDLVGGRIKSKWRNFSNRICIVESVGNIITNCRNVIDCHNYLGYGIISLQHFERHLVIEQIVAIRLRWISNKNKLSLEWIILIGNKLELTWIFINSLKVDVVSATILFVWVSIIFLSLNSVI